MRYSFIIPAKNEASLIGYCIASINDVMRCSNYSYEIIVVDNQSTDGTQNVAFGYPNVTVVESEANSIAGVRNKGTNYAQGQYFIFVDADSWVSDSLITEMDEAILKDKSIGGGSRLNLTSTSRISHFLCKQWNKLCKKRKWYTGSFIFVERNNFFRCGCFNQNLFLCEDIDFSNRLNQVAKVTNQVTTYIDRASIFVSDRKLKLFSVWEHLKFWTDLLFNFDKVITNRDRCPIWYEIRR